LVSLPDGVNFGFDAKFARVQMSSLCSRISNLNCQPSKLITIQPNSFRAISLP